MTDQSSQGYLRELMEVDRVVHDPVRHAVMRLLWDVEEADFTFITTVLGITNGNLSSHGAKLEEAGYVKVKKSFRQRKPQTRFSLTARGRQALKDYYRQLRAAMVKA